VGVAGQQLEPRAYSVSPVGTNIVLLGYGRSTGDLAFDPSLPITDASARINGAFCGYFRSIDFFGRSANVSMPYPIHGEIFKVRLRASFNRSGVQALATPVFASLSIFMARRR